MSDLGEALEEMATQDNTAEQTENQQPIKTDVDELIEFFSQCATEKDAKQAMKQNVRDKRFFMPNGTKDYSTANCYKAISRCKEKELFKGETRAPEAKDLTYKMETPTESRRVPLTPPVEADDEPAKDEPTSFTDGTYYRDDKEQLGFEQQQEQEPIDPKAAKKNGQLIQGLYNVLADYLNEPTAKVSDKDALEYGEDMVILFPSLANSKNAAAMHLIGGLGLAKGAVLAPKIIEKIQAFLSSLKGERKQ